MAKQIKVTHLLSGDEQTYTYSDRNWQKKFACMKGGLVIMWVPEELVRMGRGAIITSGRRWELL